MDNIKEKHKIKGNKKCLFGLLVVFFLLKDTTSTVGVFAVCLCMLLFPVWIVENMKFIDIPCKDILNEFPEDEYQQPKHFKVMVRHRFGSCDKLPKGMIRFAYLDVILLVMYVMAYFASMLMDSIDLLLVMELYIGVDGALMFVILEIYGGCAAFLHKFKKLNRKNWKYLMKRLWLIESCWRGGEPTAVYQGKGVVIQQTKKQRRYYAEVQMLKNGQYINQVWVGKRMCSNGGVKKIYEICDIKYLV